MSASACTSCEDPLHCSDSPLSITANIIGILTFVAAIFISIQLYSKLIKDAPESMLERAEELHTLSDEGVYLFDKLKRRETQLGHLDENLKQRVAAALKRTEGAFVKAADLTYPPGWSEGLLRRRKLWHRARYAMRSDEIKQGLEQARLAMATLKEVAKDALPEGASDIEATFRLEVSQKPCDMEKDLKEVYLALMDFRHAANVDCSKDTARPKIIKRATF